MSIQFTYKHLARQRHFHLNIHRGPFVKKFHPTLRNSQHDNMKFHLQIHAFLRNNFQYEKRVGSEVFLQDARLGIHHLFIANME